MRMSILTGVLDISGSLDGGKEEDEREGRFIRPEGGERRERRLRLAVGKEGSVSLRVAFNTFRIGRFGRFCLG
jgi:hypothetical protein